MSQEVKMSTVSMEKIKKIADFWAQKSPMATKIASALKYRNSRYLLFGFSVFTSDNFNYNKE